ncbi:MAG: RagB/SusD family nutrient uptake outer membrane protein [Prevotellaceae bacterium]|jgi:hypothetical protein|nr:RagB/SusD family nutrient uptake outer membrane protein [Prevotellaceae bacterium]
MKKKIFFTLFVSIIITLGVSSCQDFLDKYPSESVPATQAIGNANDAEVAINGVYHAMASSSYYGRDMVLYAEYKGGDFGITTTGISGDALYYFTHTPTSGAYSDSWYQCYFVLLQVNNILECIDAGKVDAQSAADITKVNSVKGQALAIRALVHFDLARLYGYPYLKDNGASLGAAVVTTTLSANAQLRRNTVAECYEQAINDLNEAINSSLLPAVKKNGYINQYGAKSLLARIYLYKGDWENAYKIAKDVIENGGYTPYTDENWTASWTQQFGTESIFELVVVPSETDLGSTSPCSYFAPRKNLPDRRELGPIMVSDQFFNMFNQSIHDTDIRWNIFGLDEFAREDASSSFYIQERKGWMMKYEGDGKSTRSAVNIKIIRLTEVLLIGAEAALKKSSPNKTDAASWINIVRKRNPVLTDLDGNESINDLLDETILQRRIDLIGEGHRYFDVLRTGGSIAYTDGGGIFPQLQAGGRSSTVDWNFYKCVLPIGINELNANPAIRDQQNPEY